jgi:hypothetical protein
MINVIAKALIKGRVKPKAKKSKYADIPIVDHTSNERKKT